MGKQPVKPSLAIGVDVGGTKTLIIIADDHGRVVFKDRFETPTSIDELLANVKEAIHSSGIEENIVTGIGFGIPGRVDSQNGYVFDVPSLKWQNIDMKSILKSQFDGRFFIGNDVNMAIYGERWLGTGKKPSSMFYVAIGTGVGGALMVNNEIIEGFNHSAGEIGYYIDKQDVLNGSKNKHLAYGTFENRVSGTALVKRGKRFGLTPSDIFIEYSNNNLLIVPIINDFILDLSIAIANIVNLINPERIIIGGGVSQSMDEVIGKINLMVAEYTPIPATITLSKLGGDAGAIGGAAYVFEKMRHQKNGRGMRDVEKDDISRNGFTGNAG